jgi:sporulation protein YlmC with PRC-barrel domain
MLRSLKEFERYQVSATDGDIGTVVDFLLDDERWGVRYLVAKTGGFFDEREVLITPISFRQVDGSTNLFHVALTKEKVKHSPNIDLHEPVSRQHERDYYMYYGYPYYWGYEGLWGPSYSPRALAAGRCEDGPPGYSFHPGDVHLRSTKELRGYHTQGTDAEVGHVSDFIIDDETWAVRYLVVDAGNWLIGKKVLIAPHWAGRVSWDERKVFLEMSRESIKASPEWNPDAPVNREYETRLYDYYGRPVYWSGEARTVGAPPLPMPELHVR